jgi:integrase
LASLVKRKTGEYVVKYYDDNGPQTLYIGRTQKRLAEEIHRHAERLIEAKRANVAMPPETAAWAGGVDDKMRKKLERLGLIRAGLGSRRLALSAFMASYIEERKLDCSHYTIRNLSQARDKLNAYFGTAREISSITTEEAKAFRVHLVKVGGLARNAVSTHCRKAKQFFDEAIERGHATVNPFAKMKDMQEIRNEERHRFMTPEQSARVLAACPCDEWRAIFCLARFGGMRRVEIVELQWEDIDWKKNLIRLRGAKGRTGHGARMRNVPLFPEIASALRQLMAERPKTTGRIVLGYESESNMGVPMKRIIEAAGIEDFVKPFLNLRSTRSTELAERKIPIQDFCRWLGHSPRIALEFYMQVRSESYDRAAASIVTLDPVTLRSA